MVEIKIEKRFATILLEAIDEALSTLGENVKLSLYFHLETKFSLPKRDIPDRVDDFSGALEKIFGQASKQVEILIMKCLNEKVRCNYEWVGPKWLVPNLTFEEYIELVKRSVEGSSETIEGEVMFYDGERTEQEV